MLGDSTTEGGIPHQSKPEGPHLESVLEQLLAAEDDLPRCQVINSSLSGEYIRRPLDSGRYDRDAARLPGVDYVFIRYGLNDHARVEDFATEFPKHFHELDPILGDLPGWYGDRHPNLAGYNVIADETARYLAEVLRARKPSN